MLELCVMQQERSPVSYVRRMDTVIVSLRVHLTPLQFSLEIELPATRVDGFYTSYPIVMFRCFSALL